MNKRGLSFAISLALIASLSPLMSAPAVATVTSVMHHPPIIQGGKIDLNGNTVVTGTLRCTSTPYNNFLVWLEVKAFSDLDEIWSYGYFSTQGDSFPVDSSAPQGDQSFSVNWDASSYLGSQARVVKARWVYYDCANNRGVSDWGYIQSPVVDVIAVDQLAPLGSEPTVSLRVRTYDVYDERYSPQISERAFSESDIFVSEPECEFDDYGDTYSAQDIANQTETGDFQTSCSGAVLSATNSYRAGGIWYESGVLQTFDPDFSPISQELFASWRDDNGNQGIGIGSTVPFGEEHLLYNFTSDSFGGQSPLTFNYSLLGDVGITFQDCSQQDGWIMRSSREEPFALSAGRESAFGDIATLVRLYEIDEQYLCDSLVALDTSQNPIIGAPRDVAFATTTSSILLSEDGTKVYRMPMPEVSTQSGGWPLSLEADAEITMPAGLELTRVLAHSSGNVYGLEVTASHVVLHALDMQDVSNSPILGSLTISDHVSSWESSSEKLVFTLQINGNYIAMQITNTVDTSSYIVALDISDQSVFAMFENLSNEWCPVAEELGYHFSAWGYYSGCQPRLIDVLGDGSLALVTPDLQFLRSASASAGVTQSAPEPDFSYEVGLNEDNYSTYRGFFNVSNNEETMWISNTDVTFHGAPIPAATYRILNQAPSVPAPAPQPPAPSTPVQSSPQASAPEPIRVPDLNLKNSYQAGEDLEIPIQTDLLVSLEISGSTRIFISSGSNTVVNLGGLPPGSYDLTLKTTFGTFVYLKTLKISEPVDRTATQSELLTIRAGQSLRKAMNSLSKMAISFQPAFLTCAYSTNRPNSRTVCNALAREMKLAVKFVKVPSKLVAKDSVAVRLRSK